MTWLNEAEIDNLAEQYAGDPILGPATRFLSEYRDFINSCSDGWPYWAHGTRCAGTLCELIARANYARQGAYHLLPEGYQPPTLAQVEQAAARIERFTRRERQLVGKTAPRFRPQP